MSEEIKCSKNSPCQECQKKQQELLAKIEDWEVKWKEKVERFEFIEAEFCPNQNSDNPSRTQYSSFVHGYNYNSEKCPSCQAVIKTIKSNGHGDQTEELKEHAHTANCPALNQIKSNQIKSNQIKSNQIKSNQSVGGDKKINYLPWILGGVGIIGLIGVVVYLAIRKSKEDK